MDREQPQVTRRQTEWWSGRRFDLAFSLALFALGLASRLPFHCSNFYEWDEVQLALGSHDFDITNHQPHPPGYTLLVGVLRLTKPLVYDDNLRVILVATISASLSAPLLFLLTLRLSGKRRIAVLASLL